MPFQTACQAASSVKRQTGVNIALPPGLVVSMVAWIYSGFYLQTRYYTAKNRNM